MTLGWKRMSLATALWSGAAGLALAGEPPVANPNQTVADAVAQGLGSVEALQGVRLKVSVEKGVATLSGTVASPTQRDLAVSLTRSTSGVAAVKQDIQVAQVGMITSTPAAAPAAAAAFAAAPAYHGGNPNCASCAAAAAAGAPVGLGGPGAIDGNGFAPGGVAGNGLGYGGPIAGGADDGDFDPSGPQPEGRAGFAGASQAFSPSYPNYAWPRYAPYSNASAVGYPTAYPWQAWPNIGPFYPYPEVPLSWRAVTLRWDDGVWWLDFKKHYTRPILTPYPFGIFAY